MAKRRVGAPEKPVNMEVLSALCQRAASKRACSAIMEISEDTIEKAIRKQFDQTFTEYRDKRMDTTRVKLQEKAIDRALSGSDTMLIFALKNICKWKDRHEDTLEELEGMDSINLGDARSILKSVK